MRGLPIAFALLASCPLLAADSPRGPLVTQYCAGCHSAKAKAGGLVLEGVSPDNAAARPDVWEKVARKVNASEMPPAGVPTPGAPALKALATSLIADLDAAARRSPYAGPPVIRRLNRNEYEGAISDILAIDLPVAAELPQDGIAAGFDNIADALSMSPLLLERYLKVARRVTELATGTRDSSPVTEVYPVTGTQAAWQDGLPFGTRGGIKVRHFFSHNGEYELRAFLNKESLTPVEGVRFFRTRAQVPAGNHTVVIAFPDEFAAREGPVSDVAGPGGPALGGPLDLLGTAIRPSIDFRLDGKRVKRFEIAGMTAGEAAFDGQPGPPFLTRVEISGPYNPSGPGDTASRRRIFTCRPSAPAEEGSCAARILTPIVRRAFRRDLRSNDLKPFLATYRATRAKRSFEESIAAALRDVLLSPDFLFRLEFDPAGAAPGSVHPVSAFEMGSRLSFFLWSRIPDDSLLDQASSGALLDPRKLDATVRRMLDDPRAEALASNFAGQWLGLRALGDTEPDKQSYPEFDSALAAAFESETKMFVRSLIRENRSILDLLNADYTYMNDRLASLYGIPGVTGPGFRRVSLAGNAQRGGLLTQGSILLLTSHAARTSPVLRGKWILENLLNSPPPPPPANVPPLDESPASGRALTTREKVERHRKSAACSGCHSRIDGLGFALENFDVIGRWRAKDEGGEIDPSGQLPGGISFSGPAGLRKILADDSSGFARGTVEKLMTYALGRELDARDQPAVREILRATRDDGYRFWDLIAGIVKSAPFRMRQTQER